MSGTGLIPAPGGSPVQGVRPAVHAGIHPGVHPSGLACALECTRTSTRMPVRHGVQAGVRPDLERIPCLKGLSTAQINVIGLLLHVGPSITQYGQLAMEMERHYGMQRTPEAIRRIVERLASRGFIRRRQTREGTMHGVSFAIIEDRLCPHIQPPVRPGVQAGVQPDEFSAPSILEEIERENLSISSHKEKLEALTEEDIAFHWPELFRSGFGTAQVRQIIQRREQVCETLTTILQGLTYAEWEIAHQSMKDGKGKAVEDPRSWVFHILASQGYYPRPSSYVSPKEQAERDRELSLKRELEACEARMEAEADSWAANLTPDEREAILGPKDGTRPSIPPSVRLRMHFKAEIWPQLSKTEKETP